MRENVTKCVTSDFLKYWLALTQKVQSRRSLTLITVDLLLLSDYKRLQLSPHMHIQNTNMINVKTQMCKK